MLTYLIGGILALSALAALWWAFVRQTTVVIPMTLFETVETQEFREWLGEKPRWMIWGRNEDGCYYAITFGTVAARQIRNKAIELHRLKGAE